MNVGWFDQYRLARGIALTIGTCLLVAGWGLTKYAEEQQGTVPGERDRAGDAFEIWVAGDPGSPAGRADVVATPSKTLFGIGIACMAVGTGLTAFAIYPWPTSRTDGGAG